MNVLSKEKAVASMFALMLAASTVKADGLDLDYFTKVDSSIHSSKYIWAIVIDLMLINYLLNLIVIGLPVILKRFASKRKVLFGLIGLTLLGQIADKVGGLFAVNVALFIHSYTVERDSMSTSTAMAVEVAANFLFSGVAISILVFVTLRLWSVPRPASYKIAVAAGVITNPAWSILILLLNGGPI